jgi:O-methyltransferase
MDLFRRVLKRFGWDVFLRKPGYHYVPDYYGRAASKSVDIRALPEFGTLANDVIGHKRTLLYYDRLYTIYQMVTYVYHLPEAAISDMAEVGVYKGGSSYFIASLLRKLGSDAITLHCFDTFDGHDSDDIKEDDIHQRAGVFNDTSIESVREYLAEFDKLEVIKGRIQNTSHFVESERFSFVHLDMDLYEPTVFALDFFNNRLLPGGVILVDDYGFITCPGVKRAVDEFGAHNSDYFGVHLLTGQYILTKRSSK